MRIAHGGPDCPVPWASSPEHSFLAAPARYRAALEQAAFVVTSERDRSGFALTFFRQCRPPDHDRWGRNWSWGPASPPRSENLIRAVEVGQLAPTELICLRS